MIFIDPQITGSIGQALPEFLASMEVEGYGDRPIRIVIGRGRQQPLERIRDERWATTIRDFNLYGQDLGEHEQVSVEDASENGVTISLYDSLSQPGPYRDITTFPYESVYPNPDHRPVQDYVYDCMTIPAPDDTYERFWQIPGETRVTYGGEVGPRIITFQIPMAAISILEDMDWGVIFDGSLAMCIDPDFAASRLERREQRNREQFIAIAQDRDASELRNLRTRITDQAQRLSDSQAAEENARIELRSAQELLDAILARRADGGLTPEAMIAEYEAIQRHAHITGTRWQGTEVFVVNTNDIELTHPTTGDTVIVGQFQIEFHFGSNDIRVRNLTNRRGHYDHPHVQNGDFCSGELRPTLMRLMSQRQIGAAVNMALAALEYCDPEDDWGRHVEWWFDDEDAPSAQQDDGEIDLDE